MTDTKNATILIIEDDDRVLMFLRKILVKNGFKVLTASRRDESLKLCRDSSDIDVAVLDMNLPDISGDELAEVLLSTQPDIKILLISGMPEMDKIAPLLVEGKIEFLQKPYTHGVFLKKIGGLLV